MGPLASFTLKTPLGPLGSLTGRYIWSKRPIGEGARVIEELVAFSVDSFSPAAIAIDISCAGRVDPGRRSLVSATALTWSSVARGTQLATGGTIHE